MKCNKINLAQKIINILDIKARSGCYSKPAWEGFQNGNGTDVGNDIEKLIKQAKTELKKYEALDDLFWFAIYVAYKDGYQYAYTTLGKYLGKEPTIKQVEKFYNSHFKK